MSVTIPALPGGAPALTDVVPFEDLTGPTTRKATVAQVRTTIMPVALTADVSGVLPSANAPTHVGDVTGPHTATVVAKINGATVPVAGALTTGNVPQVTGVSALGYAALNLAGGTNYVTNVLPVANQTIPTTAMGALSVDWATSCVFTKTLGAGANTITFANALDGQTISVILTGAASTVTWPTVKWAGGVAPTQTASGTDVYTFVKAGSTIYGNAVQAMA